MWKAFFFFEDFEKKGKKKFEILHKNFMEIFSCQKLSFPIWDVSLHSNESNIRTFCRKLKKNTYRIAHILHHQATSSSSINSELPHEETHHDKWDELKQRCNGFENYSIELAARQIRFDRKEMELWMRVENVIRLVMLRFFPALFSIPFRRRLAASRVHGVLEITSCFSASTPLLTWSINLKRCTKLLVEWEHTQFFQKMKNYDWCRCGCWIRSLSNPESQKGKSKARAAVYRILWEFYWKTFFYRSLLRWAMSWFDRMKMNYDRWKFYTTFFQSNFGLEFQVSHESGISFNSVCRSIPSVC